MKKNFFKKLASGLALAMVVTSFAPAAPAFAATATKIVKQGGGAAPTTVYVGKKVDYSLNNVYKENAYKWFTSDKEVAGITQSGGIVTPKKVGKATIKVNAYRKSTGKFIKSFKLDLTVNQRAESVDIGAEDFELAVGETKDLNAVKYPTTSTDKLVYASDKTDVATVDAKTGVVTAVAAGEATISVYAKSSYSVSNDSKYNKVDSVKVTVLDGLQKVEQVAANALELTFTSDMDEAGLKATDFAIVRDESKQTIAINTVTSKDKVVTVTTFEKLVDGKAYTLTYKEKDYAFTATDNVVANLTFSPLTVPYEKATEIEVIATDAKGVELGRYDLKEAAAEKYLDFTITTNEGYTTDVNLVLFEKGNTAKATATWHTFKYDDYGNELGAIKVEATITAVDQTTVTIADQKYTVANETPKLAEFTANTKLAIGDTGYKLYFYQKDSNKNVVTSTSTYTFESSNKDVLLVGGTTSVVGSTYNAVDIFAVAQGSAYVLVKKDDKVVYSLPVSIVAARVATTMELDSTALTLSNAESANDVKTVKVTLRDQYGDKMAAPDLTAAVETLSTPTLTESDIALNATGKTNGTIEFKGYNGGSVKVGTYVFKITTNKLTRTVAVTVQAPSGTTSIYKLLVSDTKFDVAFDETSTAKDITVKVAEYKGGVLNSYVDLSAISASSIVVKRGTTTLDKNTDYVISGGAIVFPAISIDGSNNVTKARVGSYSVAVTLQGGNLTGGFVIEDTQAGVTAVLKNPSVTASDIKDAVAKAFEFYYKGELITTPVIENMTKYTGSTAAYNYVDQNPSFHIHNVVVKVTINGKLVPITVTIGKTITVTGITNN